MVFRHYSRRQVHLTLREEVIAMTTIAACALAPAASRQVWTVQVDAVLGDDAVAKANDTVLENMIELMLRTQGVSSARLMLGGEDPAVLDVEVRLTATNWGEAVGRATALVGSCAGYAGLPNVALRNGWLAA
jgi:hypothetical protein